VTDPFDVELTDGERHVDELVSADLSLLRALVQMRIDSGLTQDDVAKAMGRDPSAVSRFERLDSDPHMSTVRRYARAVNASIQHMVVERGVQPTAHGFGAIDQGFQHADALGGSFDGVTVLTQHVSDLVETITGSSRAGLSKYRAATGRINSHWAKHSLLIAQDADEVSAKLHESTSYFTIPMLWVDHAEAGGTHD
jgi:DNA-binding XRE family transcriptional regulator